MNYITSLSSLLALCGIMSVRNFIPAFVFALAKRLSEGWSNCPESLRTLFARTPEWLSNDIVLVVLGILAVWELVANWNDTARQLLDETKFDKYWKPIFAFLVTYTLVTPGQASALEMIADPRLIDTTLSPPPNSWDILGRAVPAMPSIPMLAAIPVVSGLSFFPAVAISSLSAVITYVLASIRCELASFLRSIDADNTFRLHTLAALLEESSWIALALVAIFLPLLSLLLLGVIILLERLFRHLATRIINWFLREPPDLSKPEVALAYRKRLVYFHRCPECRMPLGNDHLCPDCHKEPWSADYPRKSFIRALDIRCGVILLISAVLSSMPFVGYIFGSIGLSFAVLRPMRRYSGLGGRILSSFVMQFFRILLVLVFLCLSSQPFLGILLLVPKVVSYVMMRQKFLAPAVPSTAAVADSGQ